MSIFKPGQRYISIHEPELGVGRVLAVQNKNIVFEFPAVGQSRIYRNHVAPVERYVLAVGETAKNEKGVSFLIESVENVADLFVYRGRGGREMNESDLLSKAAARPADLFLALLKGKISDLKDFKLREKALMLSSEWQSSTVRGMIGPRVDMIEHQYYLCYRACSSSELPRLMLSDEVGLGKTIEAGMIWHALRARGRVVRSLILVPESLKHQWMVEMKRRFNHIFTLVDEGFLRALFSGNDKPNPFLQANEVICTVELLMDHPALIEDLLKVKWDLTIVDEAHHLVCEDGFTSKEYMLVSAIVARSKGILLLTGTPLQLHPESHFNRLRMLDPVRFSDFNEFIKDQEKYQKLANDLSKLPTDPDSHLSWDDLYELVPKNSLIRSWLEKENSKAMSAGEWMRRIVDALGTGSVVFRNTRKGVGGFPKRHLDAIELAPNPKYREWVALVANKDQDHSTDIQENGLLITNYKEGWNQDERFLWLMSFLKKHQREKILLICEDIAVVSALDSLLEETIGKDAYAVFHENLSILARDQAAAWFSEPDGANLLIASEIGSEGRNFQFAHHLILFDLPLDAALVEQRIGRLDRIGQNQDIIIHVPYVKGSAQEVMFRWYHDGLGAFTSPLMSGGELFLKYTDALIEALDSPNENLASFVENIIPLVHQDSLELRKNIEKGRDRLLEFNSRDPETARKIIDEIQRLDKDTSLFSFVYDVLTSHGVDIEKSSIPNSFVFTTGPQVESGTIPGMPTSSMYAQQEGEEREVASSTLTLTNSRTQAKIREDIDFLSWEHPLTQGAIDLATALGKGSVTCSIWENSGLRGLMMQYNFVLEPSVLAEWGFSDIAGPAVLRVLIDGTGENHSELLSALDQGSSKTAPIPQGNAAVAAKIQYFSSEGLAVAKRVVSIQVSELADKAASAVENRSEQEYQRKQHLLSLRGKAESDTSLPILRKNIQERKKAAASPQLRLDAVRLIVCR